MRILITIKGGASSIEGEAPFETMENIAEALNIEKKNFILLDKTSYGTVIVNKSSIGYITRKQ
jgi:hypothetical protein